MTYPTILETASAQDLEKAVAHNHKELFRQEAIALGGNILASGGLSWTTGTAHSSSMVAFPDLSPEDASSRLNELLSFYLRFPPAGAGVWALDPPSPTDLGPRLLARGFHPGWRPHWMGLELSQVQTHHPSPKGLKIVADNNISLAAVRNLPYARVVVPLLSTAEVPGQWVRFVAYSGGSIVGQCVVFLTIGQWGVAGIYHVGVVPNARHKGIGKAVTLAACLYAREKGYRYAVLNSTDAGRRTYRQLGFSSVGDGWTWWLAIERLLGHPPGPIEIRMTEAVGCGNLEDLDAMKQVYRSNVFDVRQPLANGMNLMQVAVHCRQPQAAEWLVSAGAVYTALDAWDLGWKDRMRQLLFESKGHIDLQYGEENKTLLHIAVERNDGELTRLALAANPDLRLRDKTWGTTALDWAKHFGYGELADLIQGRGLAK